MFRYIVKRLILFVPTLFLVSCLTFFLSKQVPADQVAMLLNIQGMDDSNERYISEYNRQFEKLNLHLPEFYFSIRPNYAIDIGYSGYDNYEGQFADRISKHKFTKAYVESILKSINQVPENIKNRLFSSVDLIQLKEKISALETQISPSQKESIIRLIDDSDSHKVSWHYPIIKFNGFNNQYHKWLKNIFIGDFGISLLDTRPVTDKLWDAMKWSMILLFLNLFFALLVAFPIGVYNGIHPNSLFDNVSNGFLFAFFAIPKFWMATLLIIFFTSAEYGAWTNMFPSVGIWYKDGSQSFLSMLANSWEKLILPVLILVIPDAAYISRLIRSNVQEESNKEYIKTARSKGLSVKEITTKHILPNSLIPTITLLVGTLPAAMASMIIIEVIFNIPGVGNLMYESIENADWAMVYPIVLVISVFAILLFLIGDILMAFLNPKIKLGE